MTDSKSTNHPAFAQRRPWKRLGRMINRHVLIFLIHGFRLFFPLHKRVDCIEIVPFPKTKEEMADLAARFNWYLKNSRLPLVFPPAPSFSSQDAPHMAPHLVTEFPHRIDASRSHPQIALMKGKLSLLLKRPLRIPAHTLADPDVFNHEDVKGFCGLRDIAVPNTPVPNNVQKLFALKDDQGTALVLGTGPSATEIDFAKYSADVRIICNSTVRNESLLDQIKPNIVAFLDPVFHMGPSRYADTFRRDCFRVAMERDLLIVVPAWSAPILLEHHPEIASRLVALKQKAPTWVLPTEASPEVKVTSNVLSRFMLPLALSLAGKVWIGGCDGRKPTENYFWSHNPAVQYEDHLMETVFQAHPGFFRDRSYAGQYSGHCQDLEELISLGERSNKVVVSITKSMIPALSRRYGGS